MTLVLFHGKQPFKAAFSHTNSLGIQSTIEGMLPVGIGVNEIQTILSQCGTWTSGIQSVLLSLKQGDSFTGIQSLLSSLAADIQSIQTLLSTIAYSKAGIQSIRLAIIGDVVTSIQSIISELRNIDSIQGIQTLSQYIGAYPALFETTTNIIYLDGKNITKRIINANIIYNENSVHNTIDLYSNDRDLFLWADPFYLQGAARIEAHVGNRIIYFLLEKRFGSEQNFSLWGRSISARDDLPFAEDTVYTQTTPKSAREVVESLPNYSGITWNCDDWVLPDTFEFRGTPIEGILKIAGIIGAVVRCGDDGTIEVRNKFPVRPVDLNGSTAVLSFDRGTVIEGLTYEEIAGEGYNQIEVYGHDESSGASPELVLEESSPAQGSDVHIRIYWSNMPPPYPDFTTELSTDGNVVVSGIYTQNVNEQIEFNRGVGNSTYPITNFIGWSWIGKGVGTITPKTYTKEMTVDTTGSTRGYGVAEITYQTQYRRYKIKEHNVEKLIFVISHQLGNNVDVIIKSVGENDTTFYEAPTISDPLLTTKNVAVTRGLNWLDDHKYNKKIFSLSTPYRDLLLDGAVVFLDDGEIGCSGNFYIKIANISLVGPKVTNELEVIQWQV